jgi:hypothetical protein
MYRADRWTMSKVGKRLLLGVVMMSSFSLFNSGCANQPKRTVSVMAIGGKVGIEVNDGYMGPAPCVLNFDQDDGNFTHDIVIRTIPLDGSAKYVQSKFFKDGDSIPSQILFNSSLAPASKSSDVHID